MFSGVPVFRRVAAPDVTTTQAQPEVYPFISGFYTFVTNVVPRRQIFRLLQVIA